MKIRMTLFALLVSAPLLAQDAEITVPAVPQETRRLVVNQYTVYPIRETAEVHYEWVRKSDGITVAIDRIDVADDATTPAVNEYRQWHACMNPVAAQEAGQPEQKFRFRLLRCSRLASAKLTSITVNPQ